MPLSSATQAFANALDSTTHSDMGTRSKFGLTLPLRQPVAFPWAGIHQLDGTREKRETSVAWPIAAVARMSKVTSRTLRHYDEIGLLKPAFVASNNYRYYEQEELLRLQQILLLRELDLGLGAIAEVLDGQRDRVEALRLHVERLRAERRRLDRLARTVSRTIAQIEGGDAMSAEEMFEGFAERRAEMGRRWSSATARACASTSGPRRSVRRAGPRRTTSPLSARATESTSDWRS